MSAVSLLALLYYGYRLRQFGIGNLSNHIMGKSRRSPSFEATQHASAAWNHGFNTVNMCGDGTRVAGKIDSISLCNAWSPNTCQKLNVSLLFSLVSRFYSSHTDDFGSSRDGSLGANSANDDSFSPEAEIEGRPEPCVEAPHKRNTRPHVVTTERNLEHGSQEPLEDGVHWTSRQATWDTNACEHNAPSCELQRLPITYTEHISFVDWGTRQVLYTLAPVYGLLSKRTVG